ncbi:MAG: AAA family ATPase [Acidimicrobiia bacterium]|nr:AAA family ATPase [Acidimicrobiia bacterium]
MSAEGTLLKIDSIYDYGRVQLSLREIVKIIWRRRWLIPLTCGMAVLAVWTVGRPGPPSDATYSGSLTLTANEDSSRSDRDADDPISFYTFVVAETPQIASRVAEDLGEDIYDNEVTTTDGLVDSLSVTELIEISTMTIALESQPNEEIAVEALDRFGFHLVEYATALWLADYDSQLETLDAREVELRETIAVLTAELDVLSEELTEDEQRAGVSPDLIKTAERTVALESLAIVISDAAALRSLSADEKVPLRVSSPPAVFADPMPAQPLGFRSRLILATILGALLGIGLTFALHRFDTRLFNRKDTETAFDMPVLAEVPKVRWWRRRGFQLITAADPGARASEAYRLLRSSIARLHRLRLAVPDDASDDKGTVILVASASDGVGKSSTAANLAVAAVDAGQKALVVGADLRQPTIHRFFDVTSVLGLTDCVDELEAKGIDQVDLDRYLVSTSVGGVTLLGSGHQVPNPGERLAAARPVIERLRERFDVVIIDSPPMLVGNDVNEIVPYVDLMVLVARVGTTTIEEAQWSRETAERIQAPVCGVALVGSTSGIQQRGVYRRTSLRRLLSKSSLLRQFVRTDRSNEAASDEPVQIGGDDVAVEPQPTPADSVDETPTVDEQEKVADLATPSADGAAGSSLDGAVQVDVDPTSPLSLRPASTAAETEPAAAAEVPAATANAGSESDEAKETSVVAAVPDISDILSDEPFDSTTASTASTASTGSDTDGDHAASAAAATELVATSLPEAVQQDPVDLDLFDEDETEDGLTSALWRSDRTNGTSGAAHG